MPITPFLDGFPFDEEAKRVMGHRIRNDLRGPSCRSGCRNSCKKIIERAKEGERNPDRLCDRALNVLRRPPPAS
jgi:hypothetical protein